MFINFDDQPLWPTPTKCGTLLSSTACHNYIPIWIGHISKVLNLPFFEYQKKSKKKFTLFLDTSSDPKYPSLHSSLSKKITVFTPLRHMGYHWIIRCPLQCVKLFAGACVTLKVANNLLAGFVQKIRVTKLKKN